MTASFKEPKVILARRLLLSCIVDMPFFPILSLARLRHAYNDARIPGAPGIYDLGHVTILSGCQRAAKLSIGRP